MSIALHRHGHRAADEPQAIAVPMSIFSVSAPRMWSGVKALPEQFDRPAAVKPGGLGPFSPSPPSPAACLP